jgi:hypothetical protein
MTKKEFIKRMDKIKRKNLSRVASYTCKYICDEFYLYGKSKYHEIIKPYLDLSGLIDNDFLDRYNSRESVRILALTTFEIECLESGIYKKF